MIFSVESTGAEESGSSERTDHDGRSSSEDKSVAVAAVDWVRNL